VHRILVLFDSQNAREEAVQYSIELAKRTDADLVFLALLDPESGEHGSSTDTNMVSNKDTNSMLKEYIRKAEEAHITATGDVKTGDPQSELMKFLAGSSSVRTIVWGGRRDVIESGTRRKKAHWLVKTKGALECPIVVPSMKSQMTEG
jgi:hypothetical protein